MPRPQRIAPSVYRLFWNLAAAGTAAATAAAAGATSVNISDGGSVNIEFTTGDLIAGANPATGRVARCGRNPTTDIGATGTVERNATEVRDTHGWPKREQQSAQSERIFYSFHVYILWVDLYAVDGYIRIKGFRLCNGSTKSGKPFVSGRTRSLKPRERESVRANWVKGIAAHAAPWVASVLGIQDP